MLKKKTSFLHYKKQASRYKNDILQKKGCRFFVQQYNNTSNTYVINVNVNKILPMDKNSTQLMGKKSVLRGEQQVQPKKSTIEFLKQFARAYSYNKQMPMELGNFIAN